VRFHYNISNEFYRIWLDRHMVYSCGYFKIGEEGLDTAQEQKLDHICRKLGLEPGDRLLDIGCGWRAARRGMIVTSSPDVLLTAVA
jgi:cyclopropane-fatty-acyl-phospholipid synthase